MKLMIIALAFLLGFSMGEVGSLVSILDRIIRWFTGGGF